MNELTVCHPGSPNPQQAPTIHHMQQPAVWRVQLIGAHVVPLCWPIDAGIILHIELLKGRGIPECLAEAAGLPPRHGRRMGSNQE